MAVARKGSQVIAHLAIGFAITYAVTGSMALGGMAVPGIARCRTRPDSGAT
jgi:uncharacterized membrane protein